MLLQVFFALATCHKTCREGPHSSMVQRSMLLEVLYILLTFIQFGVRITTSSQREATEASGTAKISYCQLSKQQNKHINKLN